MANQKQQEARREFASYFLDLQAAMKLEGAKVCKLTEWSNFIIIKIDCGELPDYAREWKAPRSLKNIIK